VGANVSGERKISIFRTEDSFENGIQYASMSLYSRLKRALKKEAVCFPETLACTDEFTRQQNPVYHHHHHTYDDVLMFL
jgi:hypothetical protein